MSVSTVVVAVVVAGRRKLESSRVASDSLGRLMRNRVCGRRALARYALS